HAFCVSSDPSISEPYTRSLPDALPISSQADQSHSLGEVEVRQGGCFDVGEVTEGRSASHGVDSSCSAALCSGATDAPGPPCTPRSEEPTSELQSRFDLVCRLLIDKNTI